MNPAKNISSGIEDSKAAMMISPNMMLGKASIASMTRLMTVGFQQLRDVIFARVGQRALRKLALRTFRHIHAMSLRYHITRKTGGLSRIIERGVKGVEFLLRFLLFSIHITLISTILDEYSAGFLLNSVVVVVLDLRQLVEDQILIVEDLED